jgi:hypothetical protein
MTGEGRDVDEQHHNAMAQRRKGKTNNSLRLSAFAFRFWFFAIETFWD